MPAQSVRFILGRLAAARQQGVVFAGLAALSFVIPLCGQAPTALSSLSDWPPAPSSPPSAGPNDLVSVDLLRHPISAKARAMVYKALQTAEAGNHIRAIEQLKAALVKYPNSAAHVHTILGVEYIQTSQFPAAVDSLAQAVELLPHDAVNHSNFGLALLAVGQDHQAETELRRALELNPKLPDTRELLNSLLTAKSSKATLRIAPLHAHGPAPVFAPFEGQPVDASVSHDQSR